MSNNRQRNDGQRHPHDSFRGEYWHGQRGDGRPWCHGRGSSHRDGGGRYGVNARFNDSQSQGGRRGGDHQRDSGYGHNYTGLNDRRGNGGRRGYQGWEGRGGGHQRDSGYGSNYAGLNDRSGNRGRGGYQGWEGREYHRHSDYQPPPTLASKPHRKDRGRRHNGYEDQLDQAPRKQQRFEPQLPPPTTVPSKEERKIPGNGENMEGELPKKLVSGERKMMGKEKDCGVMTTSTILEAGPHSSALGYWEEDREWTSNSYNFVHGILGKRQVLANYTPCPDGDPFVKDKDTVRAKNGYFYKPEEIGAWGNTNTTRLPTYGNCPECFKAGPLFKHCDACWKLNKRNNGNCAFYISKSAQKRFVDAEKLAELVGHKEKERPLANRMVGIGDDKKWVVELFEWDVVRRACAIIEGGPKEKRKQAKVIREKLAYST